MKEKLKKMRFPIGLRTLKTTMAVILALLVVEQYGASGAKILFAVIGAISAMEPTVKASLRASTAQICGVAVGVLLSLTMLALEIPSVVAVGFGIILIMGVHQLLHWGLSPVLPCLVLVTICTDPEISAVGYGLARIWDTAIGLSIGMLINMLVFPYDNSRTIQQAMAGLDDDLICFLEDMFDGDEHLPETEEMSRKIESLEEQLALFADQRLLRRRRQKFLLRKLQSCEDTARALLIEVETLRGMDRAGRLNQANRDALRALGAKISDQEAGNRFAVEDLVVNYHVSKVLDLRQQLKCELSRNRKRGRG